MSSHVKYGSSLLEAIGGLLAIIGALLTPFLRQWRLRWGATDEEFEQRYPGDGLVPHPIWGATHAIAIHARSAAIWPWIVQIGQGRGGFYSYEKLENVAGCDIRNTNRILPEYQSLIAGAEIRLHREAPPMKVAIVEPNRALVLEGDSMTGEGGVELKTTWTFFLNELDEHVTRLISRTRYHYGAGARNWLMGGPFLIEPISFVMERKMLSVIKALVESSNDAQKD